ncbi:MAG: carboxy terminal-processing peptidase [Verrucomicrobia bacterium]|nr:carboxy terminal-processing peptidase [Verrucomicrobiota bacterium]
MKILIFLICFKLALPLCAADPAARATATNKTATTTDATQLIPGPSQGEVARLTAKILERNHYLQQKFDDAVSSKFLDRYLNSLDPQHIHFLQSDLAEFELYRTKLDDMTKRGETSPAYHIAARFIQRLEQRVAYADALLKTEKLEFNGNERVTLNRHELPYPKDITEARQLWHDRLRYEMLQEKLNKEKPKSTKGESAKEKPATDMAKEIVEILTRRYARILKTFKDWDRDNVLEVYLTSLAHVYDPHSDYLGKSTLENFSIGMNLALVGIGAELVSEDGYCTIRRLLPGPAAKSKKLKEKDRIVAVGQGDQTPVDVVDMPLSKVVGMIRGTKGTEVRLTVIPADATDPAKRVQVSLFRDEIKLEDQEAKAKIIEYPSGKGASVRLGIIDLPSFYASFDMAGKQDKTEPRSTTEDVARLIKKLETEKVSGIILDLRRNGGGSLEEAVKLTGLFIKEGPVVQVRDSNGERIVDDDKDPSVLYDGPLIVLTSHFSASASEIVAGALQDYGRALLVGDASTHGKGTVQALQQLAPFMRSPLIASAGDSASLPGALKVTIRKFYRPKGSSTQLKGVIPDIVLPSVNDSLEVGETSLENPLPWDTVPSTEFEPVNRVQPYLAELEKRSAKRVAAEKDFAYVREDIEQVKKALADKTVSLNEKQRLKEQEEAEARQKARDKERLARKESKEKLYELTLKQVDLPGLPAPVAKTNSVAIARKNNLNPNNYSILPNARTNSGTLIPRQTFVHSESDLDEDDEDKPPQVDVALEETKHILVDYLSVLPKGTILSVNDPAGAN